MLLFTIIREKNETEERKKELRKERNKRSQNKLRGSRKFLLRPTFFNSFGSFFPLFCPLICLSLHSLSSSLLLLALLPPLS